MMRRIKVVFGALVLLLLFVTVGCSKDDGPDDNPFGDDKGVDVIVDGKVMNFRFTQIVTTYDEAVEDGESYFDIIAVATSVELENVEGGMGSSESLYVIFSLPVSKYNNPKGTFDVVGEAYNVKGSDIASVILTRRVGNDFMIYHSNDGKDRNAVHGVAKITDSKTASHFFGGDDEDRYSGYSYIRGDLESTLFLAYGQEEEGQNIDKTVEIQMKDFVFKSLFSSIFDMFSTSKLPLGPKAQFEY
ncbi:MAG TPA: hypothetical protein H9853_08765 [Candidatus Sphingobacterium stercoripullorum]|uniref:Lipoprotein n=1 Tax=Candidatus Sphingobacterium stercoripullorum TaxID=2838759 RepID=A0A9D2AZ27_9SPHI|nr:hypothetical protein [Candidatus Sphingobacterium stercoripullorum]